MAVNRRDYLGELEHLVMWAALRLGGDAYGLAIRDELAAKGGLHAAIGVLPRLGEEAARDGFLDQLIRGQSATGFGEKREGGFDKSHTRRIRTLYA